MDKTHNTTWTTCSSSSHCMLWSPLIKCNCTTIVLISNNNHHGLQQDIQIIYIAGGEYMHLYIGTRSANNTYYLKYFNKYGILARYFWIQVYASQEVLLLLYQD